MTLFLPRLCRRGSAAWTLGATMAALGSWFLLPAAWRAALYDPIYLVLPASVVAFFLTCLLDRRPLRGGPADFDSHPPGRAL